MSATLRSLPSRSMVTSTVARRQHILFAFHLYIPRPLAHRILVPAARPGIIMRHVSGPPGRAPGPPQTGGDIRVSRAGPRTLLVSCPPRASDTIIGFSLVTSRRGDKLPVTRSRARRSQRRQRPRDQSAAASARAVTMPGCSASSDHPPARTRTEPDRRRGGWPARAGLSTAAAARRALPAPWLWLRHTRAGRRQAWEASYASPGPGL